MQMHDPPAAAEQVGHQSAQKAQGGCLQYEVPAVPEPRCDGIGGLAGPLPEGLPGQRCGGGERRKHEPELRRGPAEVAGEIGGQRGRAPSAWGQAEGRPDQGPPRGRAAARGRGRWVAHERSPSLQRPPVTHPWPGFECAR